jgi:hypothetical protein
MFAFKGEHFFVYFVAAAGAAATARCCSPAHWGRFDSHVPVLTHSGFPSMSQRFPRAPFTAFRSRSGSSIRLAD